MGQSFSSGPVLAISGVHAALVWERGFVSLGQLGEGLSDGTTDLASKALRPHRGSVRLPVRLGGSCSCGGPANDNFAAATEITQLPFSETVDASEASLEPGEALCNGSGASVWYRFTPGRDMSVKAQASDLVTYLTVGLAVYTGTSLDALTLVVCGTQSPGGYFAPQLVDFDAAGGTTYYIRAAGVSGQLGTFTLDVEELIRPANDDRSNAQPVGNLPASARIHRSVTVSGGS